eukprot:CAMPEP_0116135800 /NCGR_PEP_ID=MMETSP0329-20121206/11386_1 /TAXON_ID=697910 /ORGANISM="Pseudo-nitzschia arenysensis, Strain B593" /LENGTH=566 /DNA_ID=CAMNT_0003630629 /DNA_START=69 /DNA_END=1769 /DNA_ORIENTATION=+
MSPQEGGGSVEEYHDEKEQKDLKAGRAHKGGETPIEESCELMDGEEDSSDCTPMDFDKNSSFEEQSSNKMISSPEPIVEKGGENEFVKVSHLGSVQVKPVPTINIAKIKSEKPENSGRSRRRLPTASEHVGSVSSRTSGTRGRSGSRKRYIGDDDENHLSGEVNSPNTKTIVDIVYEQGRCAEKGESLFEEMKTILRDDGNDVNSKAAQIFGPTNAGCLVKASGLIEKSGVLYSQTWNKGSIRGDPVGIIPNHLLLILLVSNRFAKASELLLSGLCRDLEVYESVNRGLDDWGWAEKYELVRATRKNYKFKTNKRDCFKCSVFVARAHSCFLSFGKKKLKPRLVSKLKSCLDMMESHLVATSSNGYASSNGNTTSYANAKKRKKVTPDNVLSSPSSAYSPAHSNTKSAPNVKENSDVLQDPPLKRKRGRPPKNSKHQQNQNKTSSIQPQCAGDDKIEDGRETGSSRSKRNLLASNKVKSSSRSDSGDSSSTTRRVSSSQSVPSLHELISRFEDQYKEMGQRYAEMGTLLTQMKTAMDDRRTQSEQKIRRELLDEIQRNILENMPKR